MTPQNSLELKGHFRFHPFAELVVEICQAGLSGSLRISHDDRKSILYFSDGEVVYGVSNVREHRLLNIVVELRKADPQRIAQLPKSANDVEFAAELLKESVLPKQEIDAIITLQIERILTDVLSWPDGEFVYNPLVKTRADLSYGIDFHNVLLAHARCLPASAAAERMAGVKESFEAVSGKSLPPSLLSHEYFVLQQFGSDTLTVEQLKNLCPMPEGGLLSTLYVLWLSGLLFRRDWNSAFSANLLEIIRAAKISRVKEAQKTGSAIENGGTADTGSEPYQAPKPAEPAPIEITLSDYLDRTEKAETLYDVLGVAAKANIDQIKNAYFGLAKLFHPDRYHRESTATLSRVQAAFSKVQQAYETLKSNESREHYDFKVRKELEIKEKLRTSGVVDTVKADPKTEQGLENFEMGLSLLMDEEYDRAVPYLGRAAHYNPNNALYRAYFGKALSYDESQRHKAEGEMQAAAKLDPSNPKIRIMLAEFFVDMNMLKRAEGELKRFLEIAPNNSEARKLFDSIQN